MGGSGWGPYDDRAVGVARANDAISLDKSFNLVRKRVADFVNSTADRFGGMLVGGHFLAEFVPDGLPWAHIDIAGPSFNTGGPWGYTPKGGTGVPVRTLLATIETLIAD